jgi:hypothetical protein
VGVLLRPRGMLAKACVFCHVHGVCAWAYHSEIHARLKSAHTVSGGMLMCSRHEDGCMVWRPCACLYAGMSVCMGVCMHQVCIVYI